MYCEERCTFGFCIGLFNFWNPGVRRVLSYLILPLFISQNTGHLLNTRFYLKSQCLLTKPHVHFSHFHFPLLSELRSFYFYPLLHFLFSFPSQFTVCSFWGWLKNFTCAAFIFLFHLVLLLWLPTMFRICNSRISKTMEISCGFQLYSRQIWWCAIVQNSDDAVLDLGSFFLWTVSNICV